MKTEWNSRYKTISVYVVITFVVCLLIALFFINISAVGQGLLFVGGILLPFILGFGLAFLLDRPAMFLERRLFGRIDGIRWPRLKRNLSILTLYLILAAIVFLLGWYILPQLVAGLSSLIKDMPAQLDTLRQSILGWARTTEFFSESLENGVNTFFTTFLDLTKYTDSLMASAGRIGEEAVRSIIKGAIGIIVSLYVLAGKKWLVRQAGLLTRAVFPDAFSQKFWETLRYARDVFVQYVVGVLLDSLVVGGCTFLFMLFMGFPYPLLVAVIISVTNIIPLFGPIIGAAGCAAIIFVTNPLLALWFLLFILALQQIDGNIIMPHIVGSTTRLRAFWVLFALILGGGLFGFWGLLLGVPVWAVLYSLIASAVHNKLQKKEKKSDSSPE